MRTQPRIAVLLAAYNGMRWIDEQVASIFAQTNVQVTLFISVDLSTDGTEQWAQELAGRKANVVLLPYGQYFGGAGMNFFRLVRDVDCSAFDAVSFADQDDIWHLDKLERAYEKIAADDCDVYSSNVMAFWEDGREVLLRKSQPQTKLDHFFEAAGPGCTYVFGRQAICSLQAFLHETDARLNVVALHDWLAYAFCRERGFKWLIDENVSMRYRQHEGNQVGINKGVEAFCKRFRLIRNQWFRQQVNAVVQLVAPEKYRALNNRVFLLKNSMQLRRRRRDCFFLLLLVISGLY